MRSLAVRPPWFLRSEVSLTPDPGHLVTLQTACAERAFSKDLALSGISGVVRISR
jgi:hypothetical protein